MVQKELEEKKKREEFTNRLINSGLGYTELQDDYVEEYMDQETELSALEQLQKKIQKKVLEVGIPEIGEIMYSLWITRKLNIFLFVAISILNHL